VQTPNGQSIQIPPSQVLLQRGACVQVIFGIAQIFADQLLQQGQTLPQPVSGIALIDTGASSTCIDESLAQQMNLPAIDVVQMMSASHDATPTNVYPIQMQVIGTPIRVEVPRALGATLATQGYIALIGRDFLQHCTLFYNGISGEMTLSI